MPFVVDCNVVLSLLAEQGEIYEGEQGEIYEGEQGEIYEGPSRSLYPKAVNVNRAPQSPT